MGSHEPLRRTGYDDGPVVQPDPPERKEQHRGVVFRKGAWLARGKW